MPPMSFPLSLPEKNQPSYPSIFFKKKQQPSWEKGRREGANPNRKLEFEVWEVGGWAGGREATTDKPDPPSPFFSFF